MSAKNELNRLNSQLVADYWDNGQNQYWFDTLSNELQFAKQENGSFEADQWLYAASTVLSLAKGALLNITDFDETDLEETSDYLHAKDSIDQSIAPKLGECLIDIMVFCSTLKIAINEIPAQTHETKKSESVLNALNEARRLVYAIGECNLAADARGIAEQNIRIEIDKVELELDQAQGRAAAARQKKESKHDWKAVLKIETELFESGESDREWGRIMLSRLDIPKTTYREWRSKYSPFKNKRKKN